MRDNASGADNQQERPALQTQESSETIRRTPFSRMDEDMAHAHWRQWESREQGIPRGTWGWITSFLGRYPRHHSRQLARSPHGGEPATSGVSRYSPSTKVARRSRWQPLEEPKIWKEERAVPPSRHLPPLRPTTRSPNTDVACAGAVFVCECCRTRHFLLHFFREGNLTDPGAQTE